MFLCNNFKQISELDYILIVNYEKGGNIIMEQIGHVVKIDGDMVQLDVRRTSACGDKCSSCGGGCNIPAMRVKIKNTMGADIGDFVEVRMKTKTLMKSAFLAYILPLVMLILGIGLGTFIFKSIDIGNYEQMGFITGLLFLGISSVILRKIDKKIKDNNGLNLEMIRVL